MDSLNTFHEILFNLCKKHGLFFSLSENPVYQFQFDDGLSFFIKLNRDLIIIYRLLMSNLELDKQDVIWYQHIMSLLYFDKVSYNFTLSLDGNRNLIIHAQYPIENYAEEKLENWIIDFLEFSLSLPIDKNLYKV